jgi:hypothetical protein
MPWRKTRSAIRTSCCLIHPDFHPKPAITEGLQKSFSDGSASQSLILRLAAFAESGYLEGAK